MAIIKSIEEKAKRYDEAIKRVEDIEAGKCQKPFMFTEGLFDYIFPELKEREDEKIRACIGMCLTDIDEQRFADFNTNLKECRDWLEKQGEQKPQGKSALEAIKEEKVDNANKVESRQEELTEFERAVKQVMEEAIECGDTHNLKADADMLLSLVHKSAWSEEDEKKANNLYVLLNQMVSFNMLSDKDATEFKDWLKSLRPQSTWKPSDEQIEALKDVVSDAIWQYDFKGSPLKEEVTRKHAEAIKSLYNDLKKLKG